MKIKLSKSQWEEAGKKAGWIRKAQTPNELSGNRGEIDPQGSLTDQQYYEEGEEQPSKIDTYIETNLTNPKDVVAFIVGRILQSGKSNEIENLLRNSGIDENSTWGLFNIRNKAYMAMEREMYDYCEKMLGKNPDVIINKINDQITKNPSLFGIDLSDYDS